MGIDSRIFIIIILRECVDKALINWNSITLRVPRYCLYIFIDCWSYDVKKRAPFLKDLIWSRASIITKEFVYLSHSLCLMVLFFEMIIDRKDQYLSIKDICPSHVFQQYFIMRIETNFNFMIISDYLIEVTGTRWTRMALDRSVWRSLGSPVLESLGWYVDDMSK